MAMTVEQFGQEIKRKYPQYQNIPDAELGQKTLEKYPVYASRISSGPTVEEPKKEGFIAGLAKPFTTALSTAIAPIEATADLLTGKGTAAANEALTRNRNFGIFGSSRPVNVDQETGQDLSMPETFKRIAGTGAEIASFVAPAEIGVNLGVKGLGAPIKGGVKAGLLAGGLGGSGMAAREGGNVGDIVKGGIMGSTIGGAVGGAGSAVFHGVGAAANAIKENVGKYGGQAAASILGKTTGAGEAAIRTAIDNPETQNFIRRAAKEGVDTVQNEALDAARNGLKAIRDERGQQYVQDLAKVAIDTRQLDDSILGARNKIVQDLIDRGVSFGEGKALNNPDFARSTITQNEAIVKKAFNDVMGWTDTTPVGLDMLKKRLNQYVDDIPATERGGAYQIVRDMRDSISTELKNNVPGYAEMTKGYSEASNMIKEIEDALSLKENAKSDTAIRKLMSTMKQNNELRLEMLRKVQEASGQNIEAMIAGSTLSSLTPRGLAGTLGGVLTPAGISLSFINPANIPNLLLYIGLSSPRLVGEAMGLARQIKGKVIPDIVKKKFFQLLVTAAREASLQSQNQDSQNNPNP